MAQQPDLYAPKRPVPAKPVVQSYPTPDLSDRIYVVRKDSRLGDFKLPDKGDAYEGPEQERYAGFIFATAKPSDQTGWVDLFYLNVRFNENDYNLEITYPWVSKDYPRYTRTYVVLRSDYETPLPDTPDPVNSDLLLVDEHVTRFQDPVLDSLFVGVQQVFERVPAPIAYSTEKFESVLPYKMRVAVPQVSTTTVEEGPAQQPTVPKNTWTKSEKTDSAFRKTVTTAKRDLPDGGVTFISEKVTRDLQVATVTESWKDEQQHIEPGPTTVDGEVEQVGDGTTIKTETKTEDLFPARSFSTQIEDPVPAEFSDLAPLRTSAETITAQASPPELQPGELRVSEAQKDEFNMRREKTSRQVTELPKTKKDYELGGIRTHGSEFGGTLETAATLDNKPQQVEEGFDIIGSSVKSLPGGLSLRKTTRLFTGGNGTGPYLELIDGGDSYVDDPAIVFDGDRGSGAAGVATISEVQVTPDLDAGGDFTVPFGVAGDNDGILNFLGKRYNSGTWTNPITAGVVTVTAKTNNLPTDTQLALVADQDTTNSFVINPVVGGGNYLLIDFGVGREVTPDKVAIRGPSDAGLSVKADKFEVWGFNTFGDGSDIVKLGGPFTLPADGQWGSFTLTATKAYRYIRINASDLDPVPGGGNTIYPSFFIPEIEFYGDITIAPGIDLGYTYNGDANGVFYYLGQRGGGGTWRNPQTAGDIAITAPFDTLESGTFDSLVDREASNTYLAQRNSAELWFDIGADRSLRISTLLLRARADYGSAMTTVSIQGSVDGVTWEESQRVNVDNHASSWTKLNIGALTKYYRFFRLILPADKGWLMLGEVEFYGTLRIAPAEVGTNVSVTGVNITNGGSNYATPPIVEFSGGGGSGVAATAVVEDGVVVEVQITNAGTGYTSAPDVTFVVPGQGSGATAASTLAGDTVGSIAVVDGGSGYTEPPVVKIVSATGSGATAHAELTGDSVSAIVVDTPGSGYALAPTVVLYPSTDPEGEAEIGFDIDEIVITDRGSGYTNPPALRISGSGAEASATVELGFGVDSVQMTEPGTGFTSVPTVGFVGNGTGATATARLGKGVASAAVGAGGSGYLTEPVVQVSAGAAQFRALIGRPILTIGLTAKGSGYTSDPTVVITGDGSAAAAHVVRSFAIASIAVSAGGSGFTTAPTVVIPAPTGNYPVQATAHAVLTADAVTSIVIDNPGSGYLTAPTATLTGGDGTGATLGAVTLESGGAIDSIVVDNHGTGYTTASISFTGGSGSGAAAVTGLDTSTAGAIKSIEVTNPGSDYETAPTLTILAGSSGGTGATATATLDTVGHVIAVDMTAAGELYSGAVTLTFTGGGGTGAAGTVVLEAAGKIKNITLANGGTGFRDDTVIEFVGGGGTGAAATATRGECGKVVAVRLTKPGGPFVVPPTVRFVGGQSALCPSPNTIWRVTNPMSSTRYEHTATLLDDGRILITGGFDASGLLATCEIFDPATDTWSATGNMNVARGAHAAVKLTDGKVLVCNGVVNGGDETEIYDPATGVWTPTGDMISGDSLSNDGTAAVLLDDGRVLVIRGWREPNFTQLFDPATGTWSVTDPLPVDDGSEAVNYYWARHILVKLPDGTALAAFGSHDRSVDTNDANVAIFDPITELWTETTITTRLRTNQSAILLDDGRVFVQGGFSYFNSVTLPPDNQIYDPAGPSWSNTNKLTDKRFGATLSKLLDGKVLVVGGGVLTGSSYDDLTEVYDPVAETMTAAPNMLTGRRWHTQTSLPDGRVLVTGGLSGSSIPQLSAEIYGPDPTPATAIYKLGSSWPTLIEDQTDPTEGIRTRLTKSIVPALTPLPDGFADSFPLDIYRSIQIVSKIDLTSLPKPESWRTSQHVSFPPQLLAVYPIWDKSSNQSTAGGAETGTQRGSVSASVEVHGAIVITKRGGFRGAAIGRVERQFFATLEEAEAAMNGVEPTIIAPSSGTVILRTTSASSSVSGLTYNQSPPLNAAGQPAKVGDTMPGGGTYAGYINPDSRAQSSGATGAHTQVTDISDVLTAGLAINTGFSASNQSSADVLATSAIATGSFSAIIPASTPTIIVPGKAVLAEVVLEKWRFGIFVRHLIYLAAPITPT
jgi:hypothetical protein